MIYYQKEFDEYAFPQDNGWRVYKVLDSDETGEGSDKELVAILSTEMMADVLIGVLQRTQYRPEIDS